MYLLFVIPSICIRPSKDRKPYMVYIARSFMDSKPFTGHLLPIDRRMCSMNIKSSIALLWI